METPAEGVAVAQRPRADDGTAFEVFVREDADESLRHVGSVTAEGTYERATRLFAWHADDGCASEELSTGEGERLLEELAEFGAPVVLFSGGEPLVRADLEHLVAYASDVGIRPVLSTNGTLVTAARAEALRDGGLEYAGVSVGGTHAVNDAFRGEDGAFDDAIRGIHCFEHAGAKTGLRYTITRRTASVLEDVVSRLHDEGVDRFCFYHLDYGGRGVPDADCIDSSAKRPRSATGLSSRNSTCSRPSRAQHRARERNDPTSPRARVPQVRTRSDPGCRLGGDRTTSPRSPLPGGSDRERRLVR